MPELTTTHGQCTLTITVSTSTVRPAGHPTWHKINKRRMHEKQHLQQAVATREYRKGSQVRNHRPVGKM